MAPITSRKGTGAKSPKKPGFKSQNSKSSGIRASTIAVKSKSKPGVTKHEHQKPKATILVPKKKRRVYTEKELGIPTLNMITPAGVQKPRGKKKGKVFVDDRESMMTILAMVNAEKEGAIEGKMMKARQLEEIRQARQKEMEVRQDEKKTKLEDAKDSLRRNRKRKLENLPDAISTGSTARSKKRENKRVSFD